ncbi:hypothetical protein FRB99_006865 [Tulasnella sp. 403]|nr:hypothetical protein FRB99_006865 [Tulasnella sp. 403]
MPPPPPQANTNPGAAVSPGSEASRSPSPEVPKPLHDVQQTLLSLQNALRNLSTVAADVQPPRANDPPQGRIADKVNKVIEHLIDLDEQKNYVAQNIPKDVLDDVDNNRNPNRTAKSRLENAAVQNQFINAQMVAIRRYQALTPDTTVASKKEVIDSISNAIPLTIDASQRTELVKAILNDLSAHDGGRITTEVTLSALVALKTLGRDQAASSIIAKPDNLQLLKRYAGSDDAEVSKEALRCIANALLLVESGRNAWLTIGGGELCLDTMQRESTPVYVFLTARILFLSTVHQSDFTIKSVESLSAVSTVAKKLDSLLVSMQAGEAMSKDALTDTLKFIFNLLLQYPRMTQLDDSGNSRERKPSPIMGDLWDDKFEPNADTSIGPDINPITGVKHSESTDDILANMTEEEKEREAEKLFVLFNRMEKMGLAVNPLRKAQEEGRFEEMP